MTTCPQRHRSSAPHLAAHGRRLAVRAVSTGRPGIDTAVTHTTAAMTTHGKDSDALISMSIRYARTVSRAALSVVPLTYTTYGIWPTTPSYALMLLTVLVYVSSVTQCELGAGNDLGAGENAPFTCCFLKPMARARQRLMALRNRSNLAFGVRGANTDTKAVPACGICRKCLREMEDERMLRVARERLGAVATPEQLALHCHIQRITPQIRRILRRIERAA